uniref:ORF3 n=1 Tax=Heterorhabditis bacteriophora TaxID=37862 RepID=A0A1I7WAK7_HETBA
MSVTTTGRPRQATRRQGRAAVGLLVPGGQGGVYGSGPQGSRQKSPRVAVAGSRPLSNTLRPPFEIFLFQTMPSMKYREYFFLIQCKYIRGPLFIFDCFGLLLLLYFRNLIFNCLVVYCMCRFLVRFVPFGRAWSFRIGGFAANMLRLVVALFLFIQGGRFSFSLFVLFTYISICKLFLVSFSTFLVNNYRNFFMYKRISYFKTMLKLKNFIARYEVNSSWVIKEGRFININEFRRTFLVEFILPIMCNYFHTIFHLEITFYVLKPVPIHHLFLVPFAHQTDLLKFSTGSVINVEMPHSRYSSFSPSSLFFPVSLIFDIDPFPSLPCCLLIVSAVSVLINPNGQKRCEKTLTKICALILELYIKRNYKVSKVSPTAILKLCWKKASNNVVDGDCISVNAARQSQIISQHFTVPKDEYIQVERYFYLRLLL